ncbi:hypothetical protein VUR80DRAFT_2060 [Thermomyces stellatus]
MSPPSDKSQSHTADPSRANGRSAADGDLPHQHSRFVAGEMAQALKEIARGEQTASMLEADLTSLESKLDAMLAAIENPNSEASVRQEDKEEPNRVSKN